MTTQTLKRNCKNLFTNNSERLCSLEKNIPKIKLSSQDKSVDRSSPSPRLKAFPPEKIKRINDNVLLQSTTRENLSCNSRQNIGHGDAICNHEKLTVPPNCQFIRKEEPKSHQNVTYFYPIENGNQSDGILHSGKISTPLTYRSFAPNSFSGSAIQQCSPRNKVTPRPIVSHLPSHRDNILKHTSESNTCQKTVQSEHENAQQHQEGTKSAIEKVPQESVSVKKNLGEYEKIVEKDEKIVQKEQNQEFVSDNSENDANYEKQPIGGRVGATFRESYLKQNSNLQKEFPQKELKQRMMKQLPMSAPVFHRNNLTDKYPTHSQMENVESNYQQDEKLRNSICQHRESALNGNHHLVEQKQFYNFYTPNCCPIMTSPQDFSINRQKCYQHLQMNSNHFQTNSDNFRINHNYQINPNNQINSNNQLNCNNQINPNNQIGSNNQINFNNQINSNNNSFPAILNDPYSQDHCHLQVNPNDRTQLLPFRFDLVNPQLNQLEQLQNAEEGQQILPSDYYTHNNQNKPVIKSSDRHQQSKLNSKIYYFTPQMLKDQELLLNTMEQQQFPEDMMMRQFQLLLNEQKKQLLYLESSTQNEGKIVPRHKNNVSKKITKNTVDEKPDWMAHITPPRITYCEMEKIKCIGFDVQQSNWNQQLQQQSTVHDPDQERCQEQQKQQYQFQNQQNVHLDQQRCNDQYPNQQLRNQNCHCLDSVHLQSQQHLPQFSSKEKNFRVGQNQCHQSRIHGEEDQQFRIESQYKMCQNRQPEIHHQNSYVDGKMVHRQGQHHQGNLQQQSFAAQHPQLMVQHQQILTQNQPLIQNTSLIPKYKSSVPQQSSLGHQQSHQKLLVPQRQLLKQQLIASNQKLQVHQVPLVPNQQTFVHQHHQPVAPQQQLAKQQQLMAPNQKLLVPNQQSFVHQHHQPTAPHQAKQQQLMASNQKLLVPNQQSFVHQYYQPAASDQQQISQTNQCLCPKDQHHHSIEQKSTHNPLVSAKFDENLKSVETSSLMRLRYQKEIVQPQQRNNGLQDPDTIKEALEALTKPNNKKGLEYLENLNRKNPVIKLNGAQEASLIPQEFSPGQCYQKISKNISANGLENQRNSNNPMPPMKLRNFDNQLMEYPRSKRQCSVVYKTDVPEKGNEIPQVNHQQYHCLQDHIQNQFPARNYSEIIQNSNYYNENFRESSICQNARSNFVQNGNLSTSEIQEPRVFGGFTYLARKSNSLP